MDERHAVYGGDGTGLRVREERKRLGFTVQEFAERIGLSRHQLSGIEVNGVLESLKPHVLSAMAYWGADIAFILSGNRSLAPDEQALLDNYRHSSEEHKASLRTISAALAKPPLSDGEADDGK